MASPEIEAVVAARKTAADAETAFKSARKKLDGLLAVRAPLILSASADPEASAAAQENRRLVVEAELDVRDATTLLAEARRLLAGAERSEREAAGNAKLATARSAAAELLAASTDFDQAMAAAKAALQRRDRARRSVEATGCLAPALCANLGGPSRVRRAFAVHLHDLLTERIPAAHRAPLADADRAALNALRRPAADTEDTA